MKKISVGDVIPEFSLPNQDGKIVSSRDVVGKKNLVIYFYPKDETPGCTAQACSFRDQYADFQDVDADVIGISADTPESHRKFQAKQKLPFTLLSDVKNEVREKFGVPGSFLGLLPGRVTYVVDKKGVVRHVFNSQLKAQKHISEALATLKTL